jgi:hypothetical protein
VNWKLERAIKQGEYSIEEIIQACPDCVKETLEDGSGPLHLAITKGEYKEHAVHLFIRAGADVNAKDHSGSTPLHLAVSQNQENIVRLLLQAGADVTARDDYGYTPLEKCENETIGELLRKAEEKTKQKNAEQKEELLKLQRRIKDLEDGTLLGVVCQLKSISKILDSINENLRGVRNGLSIWSWAKNVPLSQKLEWPIEILDLGEHVSKSFEAEGIRYITALLH